MRSISKPVLAAGAAALVVLVAFLAFGVFGVHTLFIDEEVDEANPFAATDQTATTLATEASTDERPVTEPSVQNQATSAPPEPVPETDPTPEIVTLVSGTFVDGDHPTSGQGVVITDGNQSFLRFEEFETDNGPDLNVYLRSSTDPDDYVDLGDLKGNIGNQNYELPADIDLERFDVIDIWCVRFGVSFGTAVLTT